MALLVRGRSCYAFFGFNGDEDCAPSGGINALNVLLFVLSGIYGIFVMCYISDILTVLHKNNCLKLKKPNVQSLILGYFCVASYTILSWGYVATATQLEEYLIFERSIKGVFIGLSVLLATLSVITITISWMDIAIRSKFLSKKQTVTIKTLKIIARIFAVGSCLALLVCILVLQDTVSAALVNVGVQLILAIAILVGSRMLIKQMNSMISKSFQEAVKKSATSKGGPDYQKIVSGIGRLSRKVAFMVLANLVVSIVFANSDVFFYGDQATYANNSSILSIVFIFGIAVTAVTTIFMIASYTKKAAMNKFNKKKGVAPSNVTLGWSVRSTKFSTKISTKFSTKLDDQAGGASNGSSVADSPAVSSTVGSTTVGTTG